jgi:hypothetical protein
LSDNEDGYNNTAVGESTGVIDGNASVHGFDDTFLGGAAGPGTSTQLNDATAVGYNATVSENDAVSLGDSTADVGIGNPAPQSRLEIGTGGTSAFGDYLQIPVVNSSAKTPPAADCNVDVGVGRLVLVHGKKLTLFACSPAGVWVKV